MRTLIVAVAFCFPLSLFADQTHSAHHDHGEPDLGHIGMAHIDTSCNEEAQNEFDRALALMHSFWYVEAEKGFRKAAAADSKCGMAWWGVAMSNLHPLWAPPTPDELRAGVEGAQKARQVGARTDREKAFIHAIHTYYADSDRLDHRARMIAWERAMAKLASDYPEEREAAIFHALALLGIAEPTDKTYTNQKRAGAILNRILPEDPEHPGIAHYLIHSFDYPELAELALPAARVYAKLAPGSPHALHMPSHIFVRLGLWDESISSNIASKEKARSYIAQTMPGAASFDELHAVDYLVYAYLQQGNLEEARKLVDLTNGVKKIDNANNFAAAYAVSAVPARWAVERRQWEEAAALGVPPTIPWEKFPYAEANIHFARGIGAARSGDPELAREAAGRLAVIRENLLEQKNGYWADQVEIQRLAVEAWLARAEKDDETAVELMRAAAELESSTEKHPVTPGPIVPSRELLAEILLDLGDREAAAAETELVLRDSPNRRNALELLARATAE
jgi:tetratricopeptide (TPR) repeat protein